MAWVGVRGKWEPAWGADTKVVAICPDCGKLTIMRAYWRERSIVGGIFSVDEVFSWYGKKMMVVCGACGKGVKCTGEEARDLLRELRDDTWEKYWTDAAKEIGPRQASHALLRWVGQMELQTEGFLEAHAKGAAEERQETVNAFLAKHKHPTA